jgi:hypothetical protein
MDPADRVDPMSRIFPKMTKCIFHKFGGSGTIQRFDAICVLSMNIVNEKIYIFLWFWFIILAVVTGINVLVRMAQYFLPNVRQRYFYCLKKKKKIIYSFIKKIDDFRMVGLENLGYLDQKVRRSDIEAVVQRLSYSDWLILYYLAQVKSKTFFDLI